MDPEMIGAIGVMLVIFSVPIAAILTHHQRKMAELMHSRWEIGQVASQDQQALRMEIHHLNNRLNEQALMIEELRQSNSGSAISHRIQENQ